VTVPRYQIEIRFGTCVVLLRDDLAICEVEVVGLRVMEGRLFIAGGQHEQFENHLLTGSLNSGHHAD
jgi:hypothetical protein